MQKVSLNLWIDHRRNFEKPIDPIVFLFGKFFASFNMAILEKESLLRCIETSHDILSASSFYASIFERLDQPRRRRTLVPYFWDFWVEALRMCMCVCVCVTCTRKGNLTHRRQPSRSSSNIKNFPQSLTIECRRCHSSRQQYYVTSSKLYSFLYAVQLVIQSSDGRNSIAEGCVFT